MLAYVLVYILRLVDSVPLLCTFLEFSTCVVVSALCLKPGSATVLELSFSSCWKFCGIFLECVGMLGVVLLGMNVHVFIMPGVFSMSVHVIYPFLVGTVFLGNLVCFGLGGRSCVHVSVHNQYMYLPHVFWMHNLSIECMT